VLVEPLEKIKLRIQQNLPSFAAYLKEEGWESPNSTKLMFIWNSPKFMLTLKNNRAFSWKDSRVTQCDPNYSVT
jgi:hypothetical protein